MKIGKVFLVLTIGVTSIGGAYLYYGEHNKVALPSFINTHTTHKKYIVKKAGRIIASADTQEEAIEKASKFKRSIAINTYNGEWVYSDFNPFLIIFYIESTNRNFFGPLYHNLAGILVMSVCLCIYLVAVKISGKIISIRV